MHFPYIGSGPYCYANAFAMMLGDQAPSTAVIELATGSPFGMQLIGGALPFFDPYGEAAEGLAALIEAGCDDKLRGHLIHFAVRVGARRLADAATCLARTGYAEAARIAAGQARLVGSMQHPLVTGDDAAAAAALRALAPTYDRLRSALERPSSPAVPSGSEPPPSPGSPGGAATERSPSKAGRIPGERPAPRGQGSSMYRLARLSTDRKASDQRPLR